MKLRVVAPAWTSGTLWVPMDADEYEEARARAQRQIAYVDRRGYGHVGRRRMAAGDVERKRAEGHVYGQLAELAVAKILGVGLHDPAGSHRGQPDVGSWEIKASTPPREGQGPREEFFLWSSDPPPFPVLFVRTSLRAGCILRGWLPPAELAKHRVVETSGNQVLREIDVDSLFPLSPEILREPPT